MDDPTAQLNTFAKSSLFIKGPITLHGMPDRNNNYICIYIAEYFTACMLL